MNLQNQCTACRCQFLWPWVVGNSFQTSDIRRLLYVSRILLEYYYDMLVVRSEPAGSGGTNVGQVSQVLQDSTMETVRIEKKRITNKALNGTPTISSSSRVENL